MLKSIYIKNFILIDETEIEFSNGFNVIIGETGSGKSIILDAIRLLCGHRANSDLIKMGEDKCIIEGKFQIEQSPNIQAFFQSSDLDYSNEIILRREIRTNGKSRSFINDTPVTLNDLNSISNELLILHGQNENNFFFGTEAKFEYIDSLNSNGTLNQKYLDSFNNIKMLIKEIESNKNKINDLNRIIDYKIKELEEINSVNPKENEDIDIESKLLILENTEAIKSLSSTSKEMINSSDSSLISSTISLIKNLNELSKYDFKNETFINELDKSLITFKEILYALNEIEDNIDFTPELVESLRLRLRELKRLNKKYGSIENTLKVKNELENEVNLSGNFDLILKELENKVKIEKVNLEKYAFEIDTIRLKTIKEIKTKILPIISNLGFDFIDFDIKFDELRKDNKLIEINKKFYNQFGFRDIEFVISTIKGESLKPLEDIASGGELSRIMLSLLSLNVSNYSKLLIFDEIDTGISGRISQKVGIEMNKIAKSSQIVTITHQAQIASLADRLFKVTKETKDNKTKSQVECVNENNFVYEIAHLISGESITENSLKNAQELVDFKKNL